MNERPFHPIDIAAAAAIGGLLTIVFPRHALGILQVVIVTISALVGLYALTLHVPSTRWMSPFKWMSPFGGPALLRARRVEPDEVQSIRSILAGWRRPLRYGPPLPPGTLRLLRPLIRAALDLGGEEDTRFPSARAEVSPLTRAILTSDPEQKPPWYRMVPPNRREVAKVVHLVLDELDSLETDHARPRPSPDTSLR